MTSRRPRGRGWTENVLPLMLLSSCRVNECINDVCPPFPRLDGPPVVLADEDGAAQSSAITAMCGIHVTNQGPSPSQTSRIRPRPPQITRNILALTPLLSPPSHCPPSVPSPARPPSPERSSSAARWAASISAWEGPGGAGAVGGLGEGGVADAAEVGGAVAGEGEVLPVLGWEAASCALELPVVADAEVASRLTAAPPPALAPPTKEPLMPPMLFAAAVASMMRLLYIAVSVSVRYFTRIESAGPL
ncbi:hypothetical protein CALCODRAFT_290927 [Calocera cornea HHB12733]|uniref:Uncharacterized protein n=1 Tax=Calocera cornea HHB12733 TaxID=1353952 RepID=A0A165FT85_9BASI|nr:hypothetical protein CALCODRAFT_290927 [Calocera cornea HHB12733]